MAIQHRRGDYNDFDKSKLVPGEPAVVLSGDPESLDGKAAYIAFGPGDAKRLATYDELVDYNAESQQILADVQAQNAIIQQVYLNTVAKTNEAIEAADTAIHSTEDITAAKEEALEAINTAAQVMVDITVDDIPIIDYGDLYDILRQDLESELTLDKFMSKTIYDSDSSGVVDNSEALEGHAASYFATASSVSSLSTEVGTKMTRSTYDSNGNGIVDNAEKVNNHTVYKDVPSDAVFTDHIYDDTEVRKLAKTCVATTPSFSSLPQTYYDASLTFEGSVNHITSDMIVRPCDYIASTPSAMGNDWTITTGNGYLTISGTFSGSTGTTLKLFLSHQ